ncbi:glycosyltransferase family 4 protein [Mesorhizobium sp. B1-1-9]|uniref:glycosyltransferase n=1 Tax=Mesorhizobium sp. B1-1-9 TaxID=2589975 RepID=UPI00112DD7F9|nr:glycosyltransferase [Mesorhizobium sp. B1-1-9]TPN58618.1 glycosyltransferase family 4 protein [Mesorhizobium sp. B1-1-9]
MKRLGIFLGFTPKQLAPHEGISRLIGFITKGAVRSKDTSVTIAGPSWLRGEINALLDDAGIARNSIDIVTTNSVPYIVRIWTLSEYFRASPRRPRAKRFRFKRLLRKFLYLVVSWLSTSSTIVFVVGALLIAALALTLAIPILLVALFLAAVFLARRGIGRVMSRPLALRIKRKYVATRKRARVAMGIVDRVRESELSRLIRKLNRRKDVDVWYVPSMFWPEVAELNGKVVMAAPDIVFYEHPAQYTGEDFEGSLERITASLAAADHLISYSDYVKQHHMVERQGVPPEKVSVIRHGIVDMRDIEGNYGNREGALDVLHRYLFDKKHVLPRYLDGFRFDDVPFLFYSSQVRPHKNIEGLVATYEKILREHYRPVKLVLTAGIEDIDRIKDFINDRGLQRDIISLYSVPNKVLAALNRLAALAVTPTMFEGGFPFTFSEAYSVGTPSVMSRIPAVTEIIRDENLLDLMTFDPRDRKDMLHKILWGLENRQALLDAQRPLFDGLSARTWSTVADEYLQLMRSVGSK